VTASGAGSEVQIGASALSGDFGMISFLGAFAKLRKATISFVISVCQSA
jgi:hypothetical protein